MAIINTDKTKLQVAGQEYTNVTPNRDPHIQLFSDGYKISAFGDVSTTFEYGEPAEVVIAGHRYIAFVDLPDEVEVVATVTAVVGVTGDDTDTSDDLESRFDFWLYEADPIEGEPVDMEPDGDDDGDEDDKGEGDTINGNEEGTISGGGGSV